MPDDQDVIECGEPCDPNGACCNYCIDYWDRMVADGLWDRERHRWTDAGWRDIVTHC